MKSTIKFESSKGKAVKPKKQAMLSKKLHQPRVISKEEIEESRSSAYQYAF